MPLLRILLPPFPNHVRHTCLSRVSNLSNDRTADSPLAPLPSEQALVLQHLSRIWETWEALLRLRNLSICMCPIHQVSGHLLPSYFWRWYQPKYPAAKKSVSKKKPNSVAPGRRDLPWKGRALGFGPLPIPIAVCAGGWVAVVVVGGGGLTPWFLNAKCVKASLSNEHSYR